MRDQQGFALVTVIMVVAVLMILGTSIMYVQALEMRQTLRQEQQIQAHYLARSGLEVGLRHLEEQLAEVAGLDELEVSSLEHSFSGIGTYHVDYAVDPHSKSVELLSTGTVPGRTEVVEKIKMAVGLTDVEAGINYASDIDWYVKGKNNPAQELRTSSELFPLASEIPVVLTQDDKISTSGTHYLKAPAMQFIPTTKWVEIGNNHKLALISDFIRFDTDVTMHKADLVLNVFNGVEIEGSKKYGIIYFGGTVYRNNKGDIPEFITQGKYYLFEDGTIIRNSGNGNWAINKDLQELKDDDPGVLQAFDFTNADTGNGGFVPVIRGYSAGS